MLWLFTVDHYCLFAEREVCFSVIVYIEIIMI
jgi:hypothetical protein